MTNREKYLRKKRPKPYSNAAGATTISATTVVASEPEIVPTEPTVEKESTLDSLLTIGKNLTTPAVAEEPKGESWIWIMVAVLVVALLILWMVKRKKTVGA